MKRLTKKEVRNLLLVDTPPCVSIYVPLGQEDFEGEHGGAYRQLLRTAEDLLLKSYSPHVADRILTPLKSLAPKDLASEKSGTLVLFRSPTMEGYTLVPKALPGLAVVSDSFHLKPLLEFLIPYEEFYVLSLHRGSAKLFRGDALSFELHRQFCLSGESFEAVTEKPLSPGRLWGALNRFLLTVGFSGKGSGREYLYSRIDKHLVAILQGSQAPLLIAGRRRDIRLYRSVNTYKSIARISIPFHLNEDDGVELQSAHKAGLAVADRHYQSLRKKAVLELERAADLGRLRLGIEEVSSALARNRATTLFFRKGEMSWGTINWRTGLVRRSPFQLDGRDDDLIDDCIERAITQGCKIVALEKDQIPEVGPIAVILNPDPPAEQLKVAVRRTREDFTSNLVSQNF